MEIRRISIKHDTYITATAESQAQCIISPRLTNGSSPMILRPNVTMDEKNIASSRDPDEPLYAPVPVPLMCEGSLPEVDLSYWKDIPQDK